MTTTFIIDGTCKFTPPMNSESGDRYTVRLNGRVAVFENRNGRWVRVQRTT